MSESHSTVILRCMAVAGHFFLPAHFMDLIHELYAQYYCCLAAVKGF